MSCDEHILFKFFGRFKILKLSFIAIFLLLPTFNTNSKSLSKHWKFGFELGLLPLSGIFTSVKLCKYIAIESAFGIKIPIYSKFYYYMRFGTRFHPISRVARLSFNCSIQPSIVKIFNKYVINWTQFYFDVAYCFEWGMLGSGVDIKFFSFNSPNKKNVKLKSSYGVFFRPILYIHYDFIHWFDKL